MKAIRLHEPVGISGLQYEDAPEPVPTFGDVLVQVHACGITPTELDWPLWTDPLGHKREYLIPAHEFSGVVVGLGWGTAGVSVGDEVFGLIMGYRDGAAAQYIAVEARNVAPKPSTLDHVHAAALPQAGLTSWQALFDHGRLEAGQSMVIHGAGGALGLVAVQLARQAGARVIGTGRGSVRSSVLEMGADCFVDLEQEPWWDTIGQVDLVYDIVGGDVLARSAAIVKPGGALVTVMMPPTEIRPDIRTIHFIREPGRAQLHDLAQMVDSRQNPHAGQRGVSAFGNAHRVRGSVQPQGQRQGHSAALTDTPGKPSERGRADYVSYRSTTARPSSRSRPIGVRFWFSSACPWRVSALLHISSRTTTSGRSTARNSSYWSQPGSSWTSARRSRQAPMNSSARPGSTLKVTTRRVGMRPGYRSVDRVYRVDTMRGLVSRVPTNS